MRIVFGNRTFESSNIIVDEVFDGDSRDDWYYQFFIWDDSDNTATTYWFKKVECRQNRDKVEGILKKIKETGYLDLYEEGLIWDGKE